MFLFLDKPNVEKEIKLYFMNTSLVLPNVRKEFSISHPLEKKDIKSDFQSNP